MRAGEDLFGFGILYKLKHQPRETLHNGIQQNIRIYSEATQSIPDSYLAITSSLLLNVRPSLGD